MSEITQQNYLKLLTRKGGTKFYRNLLKTLLEAIPIEYYSMNVTERKLIEDEMNDRVRYKVDIFPNSEDCVVLDIMKLHRYIKYKFKGFNPIVTNNYDTDFNKSEITSIEFKSNCYSIDVSVSDIINLSVKEAKEKFKKFLEIKDGLLMIINEDNKNNGIDTYRKIGVIIENEECLMASIKTIDIVKEDSNDN